MGILRNVEEELMMVEEVPVPADMGQEGLGGRQAFSAGQSREAGFPVGGMAHTGRIEDGLEAKMQRNGPDGVIGVLHVGREAVGVVTLPPEGPAGNGS